MTLGDILAKAARDDLAAKKMDISYIELVKDGKFVIKMSSKTDKDAYIECSVPDSNSDEEKNYARLYFLSMVFNTAIYGMRRKKNLKKHK